MSPDFPKEVNDPFAAVKGADYVVAYCIKDFRGFEMARSLRDAGVSNAVILNPYGIKGWIADGLPTVGAQAMTDAQLADFHDHCRLFEVVRSALDPPVAPLARE